MITYNNIKVSRDYSGLRMATPDGYSGWLLRMATPDGYSGWLLRMATPDGYSGWLLLTTLDGYAGHRGSRYSPLKPPTRRPVSPVPVPSPSTIAGLGRDSRIYNGGGSSLCWSVQLGLWPALSGHTTLTSSHFNS